MPSSPFSGTSCTKAQFPWHGVLALPHWGPVPVSRGTQGLSSSQVRGLFLSLPSCSCLIPFVPHRFSRVNSFPFCFPFFYLAVQESSVSRHYHGFLFRILSLAPVAGQGREHAPLTPIAGHLASLPSSWKTPR